MLSANSHFKNCDWIDRLLIDLDRQVEYIKIMKGLDRERKEQSARDVQKLLWQNFQYLKMAAPLVPKITLPYIKIDKCFTVG